MILSVQNLTFSYADHTVLEDVSFDVDRGEFLSLLGPNGVGKSTLFRCMLGTLTGYRGRVLVEGQEIRTLPQSQRARRIAYIPQIHRPTFGYTVLDTVLMGAARQLNAFQQPGAAQIRQSCLTVGGISMDDSSKTVTVDGEPAALTPTEYDLSLIHI